MITIKLSVQETKFLQRVIEKIEETTFYQREYSRPSFIFPDLKWEKAISKTLRLCNQFYKKLKGE